MRVLLALLLIGIAGCGGDDNSPGDVAAPSSPVKAENAVAGASKTKPGSEPNVPGGMEVTNSIGMKFRLIPAGEVMMGSAVPAAELAKRFEEKSEDFEDEFPRHRVQISRPFFLGQHEVPVGQFRRFVTDTGHRTEAERDGKRGFGFDATTGKFELDSKYNWKNAGFKQDDNHPVINVSWNDAVAFCSWLTRRDGVPHRLPTEAEWEYACRGGTTSLYFHGDNPEGLAKLGNVADGTLKARFDKFVTIKAKDGFPFTAPVGNFRPNSFGLFDTHGNVWEWCSDWYGEYSNGRTVKDPTGPASGGRAIRGGGWNDLAWYCRSAARYWSPPGYRTYNRGFRVLRSSIKKAAGGGVKPGERSRSVGPAGASGAATRGAGVQAE